MEQGDQELLIAKNFFESIGIVCCEIIPPINSEVYCVKRQDRRWAAFRIGDKVPIVDFGKYSYMCGYDSGYCLVSVANKDRTVFSNRGIINEQGKEVIKPYTLGNIFNFYGKENDHISALTLDGAPIDIPIVLLKLL